MRDTVTKFQEDQLCKPNERERERELELVNESVINCVDEIVYKKFRSTHFNRKPKKHSKQINKTIDVKHYGG